MHVRRTLSRLAYVATVALGAAAGCSGALRSESGSENDAGGALDATMPIVEVDATVTAPDANIGADAKPGVVDASEAAADAGCNMDRLIVNDAAVCGFANTPCCCGSRCAPGYGCFSGMCEECGSFGHKCCAGRVCDSFSVCAGAGDGMCEDCSDPDSGGRTCCLGNSTCNANGGCCVVDGGCLPAYQCVGQ